jgi:hypothetical protein
MTKRRKIFLSVGLLLSLPAAFYAGTSFLYYAWANAAQPERWPPEQAAPWAYGSLAFAVLFIGLFVFCAVSLIRAANQKYREEQQQHNI